MSKYKNLLSPLRLPGTNVVLKNRMLSPNASPHFLQGPEYFPAEPYIAYVVGLAKNGAAVVTVADWADYECRVQDKTSDMARTQRWDMQDTAVQNYFCQMVEEVHLYGSKILLATTIDLPMGFSMNGEPMMLPGMPPIKPQVLPRERIPEVVDSFVEKVRLYKTMGYDGVTLRVDMHLCPGNTDRDDDYGGSVEGRTRLVMDCYRKCKEVFGRDFIIEAQIAGEQPKGYTGNSRKGYSLEDAIEFAKIAEGTVDILQIREKDMTKSHPTGYTHAKDEHDVVSYSEAIKAAGCRIITEPIGGFQDPEYMEKALAEGKCDMFGMARAFFADYDFFKKLKAGAGEDIVPCIQCNKCHGTILDPPEPWVSVCSVNPLFGLQSKTYRVLGEETEPKRVAVIGGGPAGMRFAITAAERGHQVVLFEKTDYLGGQLKHAESYSFKWPLREFKDWEVRTMQKLGVEVRMNTEATPDMIRAEGFDVVAAATGAVAALPASIKGLRDETGKALYPTCVDIFGKEAELGHHVVIVGGSEVGIETAMYLCENGHEVTMLTRHKEIGHNCSKLHYITMAWIKPHPDGTGHMAPAWEIYDDTLHGITEATTTAVSGSTVTYLQDGVEHTVTGDSVVICGGMTPCVDEAMAFAGAAESFFILGDCNGAGNLQKCNREAWAKGLQV